MAKRPAFALEHATRTPVLHVRVVELIADVPRVRSADACASPFMAAGPSREQRADFIVQETAATQLHLPSFPGIVWLARGQ
jgi:hypothetical protein